ncbi:MAG: hypothetical protein Q7Q71_09505 [Verrucomicrobiota bacterium JB023]|nr:hypothetical protein [Verrucomicrobiota bacterium JB023]
MSEPSAQSSPSPEEAPAQLEANRLTLEGIELLARGSASKALENFNRAIALRESLPLDENPLYRWGLAAGYIQRGNALAKLSGNPHETITSFRQGIDQLDRLSPSPAVLNRIAIAWNNQGLFLEELSEQGKAAECYRRASDTLFSAEHPECHLTRATTLLHLSRLTKGAEAMELCTEALNLTGHQTKSSILAARINLHASHTLAKARCLELEASLPHSQERDWVQTTVDGITSALRLANYWHQEDPEAFCEVTLDLFRLGLRIHRICRPHGLAAFIQDFIKDRQYLERMFREAALAALETTYASHNQPSLLVGEKLEKTIRLRAQVRDLASTISALPNRQ